MSKNFICQQWSAAVQGEAGPLVTANPARLLDTDYQPSLTRPTLVIATVRVEGAAGASGDGFVDLLSDVNSPPVTQRARVGGAGGGTGVAVAVTAPLVYIVPPGDFYRIDAPVQANITQTLVTVTEQTL